MKNFWDDLDVTDQGHSKGSVSQFYLYLGYPWSNFNKISTTMMESWPSEFMSSSPFTKNAKSQLLYEQFLPNSY